MNNTIRWIPVSERMPEEHDSIFVKKDWITWDEYMWKKQSDLVLVTVEKHGDKAVIIANTHDGKWAHNIFKICTDSKATAWMPLPEPYKSDGEEET